MTSKEYIKHLQLLPHPEGGFYKEIYRAGGIIAQPNLPMRYSGGRSYSTSIYYLLESNDFSSLHRLDSDEQWFHVDGAALTIHSIAPDGTYVRQQIGKNLDQGERPFAVVPHGCWFGGSVEVPDTYSLVGCVVAPGFDFEDFALARRDELSALYPRHTELIRRLTRR